MSTVENKQIHLTPQCQILWFPWKKETDSIQETEPTKPEEQVNYDELSESHSLDISNHLSVGGGVSFTKNRGEPSGTFSFSLDNSRDWKEIMKPGQWCLIFMTNDGDLTLPPNGTSGEGLIGIPTFDKNKIRKDKLRAICYIERVAVSSAIGDNGALNINYTITGRDFGVVYEDTTIWYNAFLLEQLRVNKLYDVLKLSTESNIDVLISSTHDLFFTPKKIIKGEDEGSKLFGETGLQWLLPKTMLSTLDIKLDGNFSFWGNIKDLKKFSKTISTIALPNPLDYINGNCWDKLKQFSVKELHELFTELDDSGNPKLIFRPIPWGIDDSGYESITKTLETDETENTVGTYIDYSKFSEKNKVELKPISLLSTNVGEDNHSRFNHFYTESSVTMGIPINSLSALKDVSGTTGRIYPFPNKASIRRHGFRPMHLAVDSLGQFKENFNIDTKILHQVNELIRDYWANAIYFESGTLTIIGNNQIRAGKTLDVSEDVAYIGGKIFYIEGYIDNFEVGANGAHSWTQTLTVSRGIEKEDLKTKKGFSKRSKVFTKNAHYVHNKK